MVTTPETRYIITPEQGQYWGGFFGEALRLSIAKQTRQAKATTRNPTPVTRAYYEPRLLVFDRKRKTAEHVQSAFGGNIVESHLQSSQEPTGEIFQRSSFIWRLGGTNAVLAFLEELQPTLISQAGLVEVMIDFLTTKQARQENNPSQQIAEAPEEREEDEERFYQRLKEIRNIPPDVKPPLSPANIAGVLDASSSISIIRSSTPKGSVNYSAGVNIHSNNNPLLKEFSESYNGLMIPTRFRNRLSDERFYCSIGHSEDVRSILETALPHLILKQKQAEVALGFLNVQDHLLGEGGRGRGHRRGDLADILRKHSAPSIDLVTMLREGFYSEMYRLNHE